MADKYFLVELGSIVEGPRTLPRSWRNISGLYLMSDSDLALRGWLPEELVGFEPFDPATQNRSGPVHSILSDKVRSRYVVTPKTPQELAAVQRQADLEVLRASAGDVAPLVMALIDALVAKGAVAITDIEPISRQKYQDLKVISDRVKS